VLRRRPLSRRRHTHSARALATLAAAFALSALVGEACAQSNADAQQADPWRGLRTEAASAAQSEPEPLQNEPLPNPASQNAPSQTSATDEIGFDSTGAGKKKKPKPKPGDPHPAPRAKPAPPPQTGGRNGAPQTAARAAYGNAYKPADAPLRRPRPPVVDPYEAPGLRVGTFVLRPSIEVSRGVDSNPAHLPGRGGSAFMLYDSTLSARSQWSRHEAGFDLRGSYSDYDSASASNRPLVDAKAYTRIDVSRNTQVNLEGRYLLSTDYPGSPNLPVDIAKLPIFNTFGGSAGLTQRFNRLELSAKANVDRTVYQDSKLTDGTTSSNHDRDYNQYGGAVRASYEVFPGVKPFVEVGADTRRHDLAFDRNGFQRDSSAVTPKVGTTFAFAGKLTGEVSVGYMTREFKDPALQDLNGVVADASLVYAATGLTTATLTASSRAEEVVVAGVSGALRRDVGLQIDHAFRRWLIGTLRFGYGLDDYVGLDRTDNRTSLGAAITYKLNRFMSVKGEYRHDTLRSNVSGVDYSANVFLVGMKLQR
jgi:hypothetical protein